MDKDLEKQQLDRSQVIVRTSIIGIIANVFLAAFKAAVGILSNSIAVVLDAVNNLSDALSSVITIIGTKLANRRPDKKHPLGHGRIEYLSALIVAAIVLYAGLTSLVESVKKIIDPATPDYSTVSLIIIASAVVVKLILGRYVKSVGQKVNSGSLVASGSDALFDAIISLSVLISALIYIYAHISLEAYVGVVISLVIVKAGIDMMRETIDDILGHRVEAEITQEIKAEICKDPDVGGAYDLILHNYGPDRYLGSVHVEVADTMTADEIHTMTRRIEHRIYEKFGIALTGIGIYAVNTKDPEVGAMYQKILKIVHGHDGVLQVHGFYVDREKKFLNFDLIIDYDKKDRDDMFEHIEQDVREAYPDYTIQITRDIDI